MNDRLNDLLADQALEGLAADERRELEALLNEQPDVDAEELELAAAALATADPEVTAAGLPSELAARIAAEGRALVAREYGRGEPAQTTTAQDAQLRPAPARPTPVLPWLLAAAASLIAFFGWTRSDDPVLPVDVDPTVARATLEDAAADLLRLEWNAGTDPDVGPGVSGDVIWSDERQEGYLRFSGLTSNEPSQSQYQLWIFDRRRSAATPVDGGVFDVTEAGEVVVPIDAKIDVAEAFAFAVTIERPGGVVVSDRERLVLTAGL